MQIRLVFTDSVTYILVAMSVIAIAINNIYMLLSYVVVNDSVFVFVGKPVVVGEDIRVTIDCSQLIDNAISNGTKNPTVTWYDTGGRPAVDGHAGYAEISADGRQCIFPSTFIPHGAHLPIDGNYTCEVCSDPDTCVNRSTMFTVCGE